MFLQSRFHLVFRLAESRCEFHRQNEHQGLFQIGNSFTPHYLQTNTDKTLFLCFEAFWNFSIAFLSWKQIHFPTSLQSHDEDFSKTITVFPICICSSAKAETHVHFNLWIRGPHQMPRWRGKDSCSDRKVPSNTQIMTVKAVRLAINIHYCWNPMEHIWCPAKRTANYQLKLSTNPKCFTVF